MQTISTALKNAMDAGNPQRVLFVFGDDEFTNEDISMSDGVSLDEDFNTESELTIGLTPSSQISFTMMNDNGQLDDFAFGWFDAYIGARIDSGEPTETTRTYTENGKTVTYAFAKIGRFYAEQPDIIDKYAVSVTAKDQMKLFEDTDMPSSTTLGITYPTTMVAVLQAMCTYLSITLEDSTFLNYDLEVAKEPEDFSMATMRDVLGWIAEAACSNARFNRDGNLEIAWFTQTVNVYDEHDYKEFVPVRYEIAEINGCYFRDTNKTSETSNGTDKTNNYLVQDNPFLV